VGANFSGFNTVIPVDSEVSVFNGVCAFSGRRRSRRQRDVCAVSLEDLPFVLSVVDDVPVDSETSVLS
jgi:hypothetical protein